MDSKEFLDNVERTGHHPFGGKELTDMVRDIELAKKVQKTLERNKNTNTGHLPTGGQARELADK